MAEQKLVDAIVRGPQPYFGKDGVLYMPGQMVSGVPADEVGTEDTRDITVDVEAKNGEMRPRKVAVPVRFRPVGGDMPTIAGPVTAADVATANPDRLNVNDFLKQGETEIVAAITNGTVDDHLAVIEQQEITRRGPSRKAITGAIAARNASMRRS